MENKQILLVYNEGREYFIKNSITFPSLDRALEYVKITGIPEYDIYEVIPLVNVKPKTKE